MPRNLALIRMAAALLVVGVSSAAFGQDQAKKTAQPTSGRIQKRTYDFKDAGKEMEYALFVPSSYAKEKKTPLMIALHGLGSNPQQIMRYRGLTDQAEKYGYIFAAPYGYNSGGWYGAKGPKAGFKFQKKESKTDDKTAKGKDEKKEEKIPENLGELSEKDVMNVLDIVRKEFTIDERRIYLMGHSMGGGGTIHLALKYPDIWAGLAPIAPAIFRPATDAAKIKHIPIILIQGDQDKLVPVAGPRRWAEQMKMLEMKYEYLEIAGGGHVDVALQNIPKIFEFFNKHQKPPKE